MVVAVPVDHTVVTDLDGSDAVFYYPPAGESPIGYGRHDLARIACVLIDMAPASFQDALATAVEWAEAGLPVQILIRRTVATRQERARGVEDIDLMLMHQYLENEHPVLLIDRLTWGEEVTVSPCLRARIHHMRLLADARLAEGRVPDVVL